MRVSNSNFPRRFQMQMLKLIDVDQGSQTRGPHVAREDNLCSPRYVLGIFI